MPDRALVARVVASTLALCGVWLLWALILYFATFNRLTKYPEPKEWTLAGLVVTLPVVAAYVTLAVGLMFSRSGAWWRRALTVNYGLLLVPLAILTANPNAAWFPTGNGPELILNWPGRLVGI